MGYLYWVASYPKSGNTWIRAFLARLVAGPQPDGINRIAEIVPWEHAGVFYQRHLSGPVDNATEQELATVRPNVHRAIAAATTGFQFLKTHTVMARHLGTPTVTMDVTAGAIYIVRNPLDVLISYSRFRSWSTDETIAIINASGRLLPRAPNGSYQLCGSWSENVQSWTRSPHDRILVLRYEDMLERPQESFAQVLRLIGAAIPEPELKAAIEDTSFAALSRQEASLGFTERPPETARFFRSGKSAQWRDVLTEEQIARLVTGNREIMQRFGYWEAGFDTLG
jgi:hypothetical protein